MGWWIFLTCRRESITNSLLNAGDMIDVNSLPLLPGIMVVSLFSMIYHGLHEIREIYVNTAIIMAYTYNMINMIKRSEPLGRAHAPKDGGRTMAYEVKQLC